MIPNRYPISQEIYDACKMQYETKRPDETYPAIHHDINYHDIPNGMQNCIPPWMVQHPGPQGMNYSMSHIPDNPRYPIYSTVTYPPLANTSQQLVTPHNSPYSPLTPNSADQDLSTGNLPANSPSLQGRVNSVQPYTQVNNIPTPKENLYLPGQIPLLTNTVGSTEETNLPDKLYQNTSSPNHQVLDPTNLHLQSQDANKQAKKIAKIWQDILQILGKTEDKVAYLTSEDSDFIERLTTYLQQKNDDLSLSMSRLLRIKKLPHKLGFDKTIFNRHFKQLRQKQKTDCKLFERAYHKQNKNRPFKKQLNLKNRDLVFLPKNIEMFDSLEILNLSYNNLYKLPKEFGNLVNLYKLNLSHNKLHKLPKKFGNLINIHRLYLRNNKFKQLPEGIGKLVQVKWLSLSSNPLITLPESITNLTKAQTLYLNNTEIDFNKLNQSIINWIHGIKTCSIKNCLPPMLPISHVSQENPSLKQANVVFSNNNHHPDNSNAPGQLIPPSPNTNDTEILNSHHRTHWQMEQQYNEEILSSPGEEPPQKKQKIDDDTQLSNSEISWPEDEINFRHSEDEPRDNEEGNFPDTNSPNSDYSFSSFYGL